MGYAIRFPVKQNAFALEVRRQVGLATLFSGKVIGEPSRVNEIRRIRNSLLTQAPPLVFAENLESIDTAPPEICKPLRIRDSAEATVEGINQTFGMKVGNPINQTSPEQDLQRRQEMDRKRRRTRK